MPITQQNSVFIDPVNCGSSVGYYITLDEYTNHKDQKTEYTLSATVILADCSHKIDWSFGGESDNNLDKITAAIDDRVSEEIHRDPKAGQELQQNQVR